MPQGAEALVTMTLLRDTEACCTCASLITSVPRTSETEKPLPDDRRLLCCSRIICGHCIHKNSRFAQYCPYCQISNASSTLPPGLKEPPVYTSVAASSTVSKGFGDAPPPPYTPRAISLPANEPVGPANWGPDDEKRADAGIDSCLPAEDVLHFLNHDHDTVASLSLRYGIPVAVLRQVNKLTSDHLLLGRRTVLIPGAYYKGGVSLSPRPVEGEEEELRKSKIRRFMIGCKVADYDVALLYLEQAGYDLPSAIEAFFDDEAWERDHPNIPKDQLYRNQALRNPVLKPSRGRFWRGR